MSIILSPSILSADFSKLGEEIQAVKRGGAQYLHIDVMDGHFVPNISYGQPVIKALRPHSKLCFDVHLMIQDPLRYIDDFCACGADIITFHLESTDEPQAVLRAIHANHKKAGVAIKPSTSPTALAPYLSACDMILVMTVEPGFGAQKLLPETLQHVHTVRQMIRNAGAQIDLEVDGGIKAENIALAAKAGANVFVAGSAVFGAADKAAALQRLRTAAMQGAAQAE